MLNRYISNAVNRRNVDGERDKHVVRKLMANGETSESDDEVPRILLIEHSLLYPCK